jgi:hypothetical protein
MLEAIGLALAGRFGAWLASALGLPVGRSALLRLLRALPDPEPTGVTCFRVRDRDRGSISADLRGGLSG